MYFVMPRNTKSKLVANCSSHDHVSHGFQDAGKIHTILGDSGASYNYFPVHYPGLINKRKADSSVSIRMPDGNRLQSTQLADLPGMVTLEGI